LKKRSILLLILLTFFFLIANTLGPELASLIHSQKAYSIYTVQAKGSSGFHSGSFSSSKSSGGFKSGTFSSIPKASSSSSTGSGSSLFGSGGNSHSFIPIPMFSHSYFGLGNGIIGGFGSIFLKFLVVVVIIIVIRRMFKRH